MLCLLSLICLLEAAREYWLLPQPPALARFFSHLRVHGENTLAAKLCLGLLSTLLSGLKKQMWSVFVRQNSVLVSNSRKGEGWPRTGNHEVRRGGETSLFTLLLV